MKNLQLVLTTSAVILLAAGCGGGGGGSSAPPPPGAVGIPTAAVQITPSNAATAAKAGGSAQTTSKTGGSKAGVVGVVAQSSAPPKALWQSSVDKFLQGKKLTQSRSTGVVGVIANWTPIVTNCAVSGTSTLDLVDTNNNGVFDVGDAFVITDALCVNATGYSTNGKLTMTIGANPIIGYCTANPPSSTSLSLTMTMTNYVDVSPAETLTTNGDMSIALFDDCYTMTATISGNKISENSSVNHLFEMSNYNISYSEASTPTATTPYSYNITMTTASADLGGTVTITTPTPLSGVGISDPTAGVMVITGKNNSTLTLTTLSNGAVTQVVDEDGSGPIAPVTLANTTWAAL